MIWAWALRDHKLAIDDWIIFWLDSSFPKKALVAAAVLALPILLLTGILLLTLGDGWWLLAFFPILLFFIEILYEGRVLKRHLRTFRRMGALAATRARYVGGHPELPHGRYVYLTINGYRDDPQLSIWLQGPVQQRDLASHVIAAAHSHDASPVMIAIPLLDLDTTEEKRESAPPSFQDVIVASSVAALTERPARLLGGERLILHVKYDGPTGRKHSVELTSFLKGTSEIRNWRNFLICAQAEAETDIQPVGPWRSLRASPPPQEELSGTSGNGRRRAPGSAFRRG